MATRDDIVVELARYEDLVREELVRIHKGYGNESILQYYEKQLSTLRRAAALEENNGEA
jgi:hypothetical protein